VKSLLNEIPTNVRSEIVNSIFNDSLNEIDILRFTTTEFREDILPYLKREEFKEGQVVYGLDETPEKSIYLLFIYSIFYT